MSPITSAVLAGGSALVAHGLTLVSWWLRIRWQLQQDQAHQQYLLEIARALPEGGQIHESRSDGSWTRLAVSQSACDKE